MFLSLLLEFSSFPKVSTYKINCEMSLGSASVLDFNSKTKTGQTCTIYTKIDKHLSLDAITEVVENVPSESQRSMLPEELEAITSVNFYESSNLVTLPVGIDNVFPNLLILDLENQGIDKIRQKDLMGFKNLKVLVLKNNKIKILESDLFKHNEFLQTIDFRHNKVLEIAENTFSHLKYLHNLLLEGNNCVDSNALESTKVVQLIHNLQTVCMSRKMPKMELTVKRGHSVNWMKYFWYFLAFGTVIGLIFVYGLMRVCCTVRVGPGDGKGMV